MVEAAHAEMLNAVSAALILHQNDRIIFINDAAAALCSSEASDLTGAPLERLIDQSKGEPFLRTRGAPIPVTLTSKPVTHEGQPAHLLTVQPVEANDLYRTAVDGSLDAFFLLQIIRDANGSIADLTCLQLNERALELLTLPPERLIGSSIRRVVLESPSPQLYEPFTESLSENKALFFEGHLTRTFLREGWYQIQIVPLGDRVAVFIRDISVRKAAEDVVQKLADEVEQQARMLDEILAATPDRFLLFDRQGHYLFVNRKGLEDSGLNIDQVLGKTWRELGFPEEVGLLFDSRREQVFNNGESITYEDKFPTINGLRDFLGTLTPIHDRDGSVVFMLNTIRDITELKQTEEALRESQRLFTSIYESELVGIAVIDKQGNLVRVNRTSCDLVGFSPTELIGKHFTVLYPPEVRDLAQANHDRVISGETPSRVDEWSLIRKDGQTIETNSYSNLLVQENGARFRVVVITDASEQRRAQRALEASEQRLTSILGSMQDVVWSVDPTTHELIYVNPTIESLTGYAAAAVSTNQRLLANIVHEDDRADFTQKLDEAINGTPINSDYRIVRRDGALRWVHNRFWLVRDAQGKPQRIDGIMTDITDRRQASEQATQVAIERERVRILSDFVRDASHEFRTPLSVINTRLYLMEKVKDPVKQTEYIESIKSQTERILKLVESLITMSKLDAATEGEFESLDLNRLLTVLNMNIEAAALHKQITFTLELAPEPFLVRGETSELMTAFNEVCNNAISYTPDGGTVSVRCYRLNEGEVAIDILDTGSGISAEEMPHIFDRFYRGDHARTKRGFGLGLTIARRIVERHGGRIDVTSEPGKGSLFRLVFPQDTAAEKPL